MNAIAIAIMASSAGLGSYIGTRAAHRRCAPPVAATPDHDSAPGEDLSAVAFDWAEKQGRPDIALLVGNKLAAFRRIQRRRQTGRFR